MVAEEFVDIMPGTEVMKDHDGIHFIHARNAAQGPILLPTPSEHPHDPLRRDELVHCTSHSNLHGRMGQSLSQVALLTGVCVITLGYANFIIVPGADIFGRRTITLFCGSICIAANIWSALATSDIDEEEKDSATQIEAATTAGGKMILTDAYLGRGRPNLSQFNPFQPLDRVAFQTVLRHILTPVQLFFYPIVFWAAMSMGAAANALLAVNITQSQGLAAPPYNFTPGQVGFANFALVAGGVIGLLVAGPWSDWVIMATTKKNNGIREAEMRLPALYPFIFAALIGLVVIGVGYDKHWPWEVIVVLGFGLVGLQVVSIPTIAITYAIDCYTPVAGQIMVISTVCKNTFGFGQTYYYNNWATASGFTPPFMMIMALTVGFSLTGTILLPFFGKRLRVATRASKVHNF
ncbi:hypothetical protein L207DRAFT_537451 [Hyaloscypha variabilis F]|uniref:MFS general substrate transporter n=1 Tax=Hyaloscypha variabilis (strain UAMH 11265 / GT02V1 / F) TaxID=1149755 RepID=A0A2J6QXM4_HYAVF|nr:hypothetical protein L207DRAFT_537451 [Hyaloscypha variabilis F]